jgi:hypothetical protein
MAQAEGGVVWSRVGVGGMVQQDQESVKEQESKVGLEKGMGDTGREADRRCQSRRRRLVAQETKKSNCMVFFSISSSQGLPAGGVGGVKAVRS